MANQTNPLSTENLWTLAHSALCEQRWSAARALLDDLGRRTDVRDYLGTAASYGLTGPGVEIIQDRIDLVNAHVDACRE